MPIKKIRKMILYSIVFGKDFIDKFFDICLPSLMTENNIPSLNEKITLLIPTVKSDLEYVKVKIQNTKIAGFFGDRINIVALDAEVENAGQVPQGRVANVFAFQLLLRVIALCIERQESFLFASPDCIYSDGVVGSAWELHKITGKVVSIFCGRVSLNPQGAAYYNNLIRTPNGVRDEFLRSMALLWSNMATDDATNAGVDILGHYMYRDANKVMILTDHPNPFLGRFTPEDLDFFLEAGELRPWDNGWEELLLRQGRLVVQTNLDVGMMIETDTINRETSDLRGNLEQARQRHLRKLRIVEPDSTTGSLLSKTFLRKRRFRNPLNAFVFTAQLSVEPFDSSLSVET
jgi:hypothetical protein